MNPADLPPGQPAASFQSVFGPLDLDAAVPLATGGDRHIFQHPHMPSLLVKVMDMRARAVYLEARPFKRWYKQYQRESAYRVYLNEISEYVTTTTRPSGVWQVPMARILGVAQTTLGLGLVVEKICDEAGNIAPRWPTWRGRASSTRRSANSSTSSSTIWPTRTWSLHDVSASNIACGFNADGKPGLYLIDGFGVLPLIPLYAWSKRLNSRRIERKYAEMRASLARRFAAPAA